MKITVMIQYIGHVVHCGGVVTYRAVEIELTDAQATMLRLDYDESFGVVAISAVLGEGEMK